mgnify:CR=1 FL=1
MPAPSRPVRSGVRADGPFAGGGAASGTSGIARSDVRPLDVALPRLDDDPLGFPGYPEKLAALRTDGDAHAVDVGMLDLAGYEVVVARGRFDVLAGSMGRTHGTYIATALARARELRLPFVALTSSGGARMQEGMLSLVQMSRAAEGIRALRESGVPAFAHLGHPTTGGVFASYAALADVLLADPGATVGFAGPRVVEAATGETVGGDSHTGAAAHAAGLVDGLASAGEARAHLAAWVALAHPAARSGGLPDVARSDHTPAVLDAHEVVERTRREGRPTARDLLRVVFDTHEELTGDRAGGVDPVAVAALARLGGRSIVVVGFDRAAIGSHGRRGMPGAAGFRTVQRALELARRWGLPVVALVDTRGADPSPASERTGLVHAIAETFVALLDVPSPTLGIIIGEGGSGGALALATSDRLLLQEDAFLTVISPEGAATILHRDASRAAEVVGHLRPTATELVELGIADRVLPGPTTAGPERAADALRAVLVEELRTLDAMPDRLQRRRQRYGA